MSFFAETLTFTPQELDDVLCQHILNLSQVQWRVHAAFQRFAWPRRKSLDVMAFLEQFFHTVDTCVKDTPIITESDLQQQLCEVFPDIQAMTVTALLREYLRSTPPPYAMSRTFEQWRTLRTGQPREKPMKVTRDVVRSATQEAPVSASKHAKTPRRKKPKA